MDQTVTRSTPQMWSLFSSISHPVCVVPILHATPCEEWSSTSTSWRTSLVLTNITARRNATELPDQPQMQRQLGKPVDQPKGEARSKSYGKSQMENPWWIAACCAGLPGLSPHFLQWKSHVQGDPKRATNGSTKLPFQRFGVHNLDHLQIIFLGISDFKVVPASKTTRKEWTWKMKRKMNMMYQIWWGKMSYTNNNHSFILFQCRVDRSIHPLTHDGVGGAPHENQQSRPGVQGWSAGEFFVFFACFAGWL